MASYNSPGIWQDDTTLLKCLDSVCTTGLASDVTFLVGEHRKRLHAHKLILECRSQVFFVMFEGLLAENNEVAIPDIDPDIFELFLRYLYTDKILLTDENAGPLLNLSRKYWVDVLVSDCERYLQGRVTSTNACMLLELSLMYMIDTVQVKCLQVIIQQYLRDTALPEVLSGLYPNVTKVFRNYADVVGKARGKYWTLLTWLKAAKSELKNSKEITLPQPGMKKTISECLDYIYKSGAMSDVTFIVGKTGERISAHRLVLSIRSPVFYVMFEGLLAAKGEIIISDMSARHFRLFLRYLYTDDLDLTPRNAVAVNSVAEIYCVDSCYTTMISNINVHNVCSYLEQAHISSIDKLRRKCFRLISKHPTEALESASFGELCPSCMASVAESDDIHNINERDVYMSVIRWAVKECTRQGLQVTPSNKRKVLGDLIYVVRFPAMDKIFIEHVVYQDNILPDDAVKQLLDWPQHESGVTFSKFNGRPRRNKRWAIYRCA